MNLSPTNSESQWIEIRSRLQALAERFSGQPELQKEVQDLASQVDRIANEQQSINNSLAREWINQYEMFKSIHDAIIGTDLEHYIIFWNTTAEELYGWKAEEVMGHPIEEIIPSSQMPGEYNNNPTRIQRSNTTDETVHYSRSGKKLYIERTFTTICDPSGQPAGYVIVNRDITERQLAKQALQLSESRLLTLVQNLPVGVLLTDDQGTFIISNPANLLLFGETGATGDASGPSSHYTLHYPDGSSIPTEDLPLVRALHQGESSTDYEFMIRHEDGEDVYVLSNTSPLYGPGGVITGAIATMQDITPRKRYEASLQESEKREREKAAELEAIMDSVPAYIWVSRDAKSRWIDGNRAAHEVLRMKTGENLSKTAPEGEIPRHFQSMRYGQEIPSSELPVQMAAARGVEIQDYEFDLVFDDGEVLHLIGNAVPLFDDQGKPRGAISAFIDITDRKQAEQALNESELRFRIALANVPITVYTMDRNLRYTWIYNLPDGVPARKLIGKREDEINSGPEVEEMMALKRSVIETGQGIQQEIKSSHQGEDKYFILTLEPILDSSDNVVGLTGALMDVSRQRGLEAERQEYLTQVEVQRRLMENREKERQGIARDIHDGPIQTLVSTLFNLQISKDAIPDPLIKVELNQVTTSIKAAVRELREVVNELRPPSLLRFGLTRAILMHCEDTRERQPDLNLDHDLIDDGGRLADVLCLTLFRIYQESMNNVIRHSKASQARVRLARENDTLVLEISDNGSGFAPHPNLAEQTHSGHFGLAGMKERAEAAGGTLEVISKPGIGTTIRVRVPWIEKEI